jgi:nicotinate phosphoribosyltransferase
MRTDRYELTMLDASLADGTAGRPVVFEAFARSVPGDGTFGVVGGTDRVVEAIAGFSFNVDHLAWLGSAGVVSQGCLDYLASYRFGGTVRGYPEGEVFFAGSPVLSVAGTFAEAVVIETVVLSILNHGCAVATAAARIRQIAGDATLLEMGSRRGHEEAAVEVARLAWVGGFDATSNLAAGQRFGVPTVGTAAHAWTLVHDDEQEAFGAQLAALGPATTLLVDTYDIATGIERAVAAARLVGVAGPGAVRIDSGDLEAEARHGRAQLDRLGAQATRIVVSGDLDRAKVAQLRRARAPIDGFGVGSHLVAAPPAGFVYKLVAVGDGNGLRPVEKRSASPGKASSGGTKTAWRTTGADGSIASEVLTVDASPPAGAYPVAVPLLDGAIRAESTTFGAQSTAAARNRCSTAVATVRVPVHIEVRTGAGSARQEKTP